MVKLEYAFQDLFRNFLWKPAVLHFVVNLKFFSLLEKNIFQTGEKTKGGGEVGGREDRLPLGRKKTNAGLFCSSLGLHYLCTLK